MQNGLNKKWAHNNVTVTVTYRCEIDNADFLLFLSDQLSGQRLQFLIFRLGVVALLVFNTRAYLLHGGKGGGEHEVLPFLWWRRKYVDVQKCVYVDVCKVVFQTSRPLLNKGT